MQQLSWKQQKRHLLIASSVFAIHASVRGGNSFAYSKKWCHKTATEVVLHFDVPLRTIVGIIITVIIKPKDISASSLQTKQYLIAEADIAACQLYKQNASPFWQPVHVRSSMSTIEIRHWSRRVIVMIKTHSGADLSHLCMVIILDVRHSRTPIYTCYCPWFCTIGTNMRFWYIYSLYQYHNGAWAILPTMWAGVWMTVINMPCGIKPMACQGSTIPLLIATMYTKAQRDMLW